MRELPGDTGAFFSSSVWKTKNTRHRVHADAPIRLDSLAHLPWRHIKREA